MILSCFAASAAMIWASVACADEGDLIEQVLGAIQARQAALMSTAVTINVVDRSASPSWPDSETHSLARLGQTFRYDVKCTSSPQDDTANIDEVVLGDGGAIMRWVPAHARADVWAIPATGLRNALPSSFLFSLWWPSFLGLEEVGTDVGAMILSGDAAPLLAGAPEGVCGAVLGFDLGPQQGHAWVDETGLVICIDSGGAQLRVISTADVNGVRLPTHVVQAGQPFWNYASQVGVDVALETAASVFSGTVTVRSFVVQPASSGGSGWLLGDDAVAPLLPDNMYAVLPPGTKVNDTVTQEFYVANFSSPSAAARESVASLASDLNSGELAYTNDGSMLSAASPSSLDRSSAPYRLPLTGLFIAGVVAFGSARLMRNRLAINSQPPSRVA
ncbi:MAG: hypothetical protein U0575_13935 [Phycisphaerales bacterium]